MAKTVLAMLAALPMFTACVDEQESLSTEELSESAAIRDELLAARKATAKYHDFAVATADGYVDTGLPCIDGQGFHYINPALLGTNDVTLPQVLMYLPDATGTLRLVGLEWLEPIADETTQPLALFGETFHGPNNLAGVPFSFFALHVWAWQHNPSGLFSDRNPNVRCQQ